MLGHARQWHPTLVYGLAHFGKSLFWYSSEILFAYFLTEFVDLPAAAMGMVIATGLMVSAAIDAAMGLGLRRWLISPSGAGRMQLFGAAASAAALLSVFLGAWIPAELRYGYAIAAGIAFRLAFALYDIPQNAVMSLATVDPSARLRVASTRIWFSGAATLAVAAAVGPMVASRGDGAGLLFGLVAAFALVAIASAAMLARTLPPSIGRDAPAPPGIAWRPPGQFWLLVLLSLLTTIFTPAFSKFEPYFAAYSLRSAWWGGAIIALMAIGILVGQPLWLHLCARMARAWVLIGAALLQILSLTAFGLAGARFPTIATVAALGFGLGNGGVGMVLWAALSETVARHAPGRAGIAYGLFGASGKIGLAIGGVLIAAALDASDFRDPANVALAMLMAWIPGCGAGLIILNGAALLIVDRRDIRPSRV